MVKPVKKPLKKGHPNLSLKMFLIIMMAACVLGNWQNWGGFAQVKLDLLEFGQNNLSLRESKTATTNQ